MLKVTEGSSVESISNICVRVGSAPLTQLDVRAMVYTSTPWLTTDIGVSQVTCICVASVASIVTEIGSPKFEATWRYIKFYL